MSKRQAGLQITRENLEDDPEYDRDGPPEPAVQASAEVMATRKLAMPKSRRRAGEQGESGSTAPAPAANPFSFGMTGATSSSGGDAPASKPNPFANVSFGTSSTQSSSGQALKPFSFGAPASTQPALTSGFSFGAPAQAATTPSTSSLFGQAPAPTPAPANTGTQTSNTETGNDVDDAEYQDLLHTRSVNTAFLKAVQRSLDNDPFADLTKLCGQYESKKSERPDKKPSSTMEAPKTSVDGATSTSTSSFAPSTTATTSLYPKLDDKPADKPAEPKAPSFSFNAQAPSFSFGAAATKPVAPATETPKFSFGGAQVPAFGKPAETKPTESSEKKDEKIEAATATPKPDEKKDHTWTPDKPIKFASGSGFSFQNPLASPAGAPASGEKDSGSAATTTSAPPSTTGGFSFGKSSGGSAASTGFSFGQAAPPAATGAKTGPATFSFGQTSSTTTPSFGFGSATAAKSSDAPKPAFSFGSSAPAPAFSSTTPTFNFAAPKKADDGAASGDKKDGDDNGEGDEDDDDEDGSEVGADLGTATGAGEEDETALITSTGKLYHLDPDTKAYQVIGPVAVKVSRNSATDKVRVLARQQGGLGQLRLNTHLHHQFNYDIVQNQTTLRIFWFDEGRKIRQSLIRFPDKQTADDVKKCIDDNKG